MKKIRTLSICVVAILLIGLLLVTLFFQRTNFKGNGYHFIQFNSSFAAEQHSNYVIDLPYFIKSSNKDILLKDNILNIKFKNSSLTEVEKFDLKFGDKLRNYVTKTISLTTKFIKSGKEKINYIEVTLKDGKKINFYIGDWKFEVIEKANEYGYLDIGKSVSVMANYFTDFPLSLHNNSRGDVKIKDIKTNIPDIELESESITLKPGEYVDKVLKIKRLNNLYDKQVFWLIRPLITYTLGEREYHFVPPAIYYGILGLDDNRVQEELNKDDF